MKNPAGAGLLCSGQPIQALTDNFSPGLCGVPQRATARRLCADQTNIPIPASMST
jgi:hypothetical protein